MVVKTDSEFKQFYWDLASADKHARLKAAQGLVQYIIDRPKAEKDEYVTYSVERLIKGLSSSHDAARQGFSVTLCEVLKLSTASVKQVLELLDRHIQVILLL
jgi:DNA polymerase phi